MSKTIKTDLSNEEREFLKESNKKVANEYAKVKGAENIQEIVAPISNGLNSGDPITVKASERIAQGVVEDLVALCLQQSMMFTSLSSNYDIVEKVYDGTIKEGNSREYFVSLDTGHDTHQAEMFIPTKQTLKQQESYLLQMYDANKQLNPKAYQYLKEMTIPQGKWIPYFKSGKLNEFISGLMESIYRNYKIFLFNKVATIISDQTKGKVVNGRANNLYDALQEFLPMVEEMYLLNSEFNSEQTSKFIDAKDERKILIFASTKVKSRIKNGIKTQLFNADLLGAGSKTLTSENLYNLGNKIQMTTQDAVLVDTKTPWIDDNTLIAVEINSIKQIDQLKEVTTQFFSKNLTLYVGYNVWGIVDALPWGKKLVYKNANLSTLPASEYLEAPASNKRGK